jgi:hypothetical protein
MSFKCDLNPVVSILTVWKVSGCHGHPFQFPFHMNTLWWVWKNILNCWAISHSRFPVLPGWCSVTVWVETRLQAIKPILEKNSEDGGSTASETLISNHQTTLRNSLENLELRKSWCFQLPVKAYGTAYFAEASQQVKSQIEILRSAFRK